MVAAFSSCHCSQRLADCEPDSLPDIFVWLVSGRCLAIQVDFCLFISESHEVPFCKSELTMEIFALGMNRIGLNGLVGDVNESPGSLKRLLFVLFEGIYKR